MNLSVMYDRERDGLGAYDPPKRDIALRFEGEVSGGFHNQSVGVHLPGLGFAVVTLVENVPADQPVNATTVDGSEIMRNMRGAVMAARGE